MLAKRKWQVVMACASCVLACVATFAEDKGPGPVTGVKTVPAMYVAWDHKQSVIAHLDKEMTQTFQELWQACVDNGLHPIGTPMLSVERETPPDDKLDWQAWIPLADQPRQEELTEKAAVRVKAVPQANVAFTYHYGAPFDLQDTFLKLAAWAMGQGYQIGGKARAVVYVWPGNKEEKYIVTECQLEYTK